MGTLQACLLEEVSTPPHPLPPKKTVEVAIYVVHKTSILPPPPPQKKKKKKKKKKEGGRAQVFSGTTQ